jgi:hypothetical protein
MYLWKVQKNYNPMKKLLILVLMLGSFLTACTEDQEPGLPAATTEGLNTAGCYVDGKLWYARKESYSFNDLQKIDGGFTGRGNDKYYWMWMTDRVKGTVITIYIDGDPESGKVYQCNTTTNPRPAYLEYINYCSYNGPEGHFMTNENATGTVTFSRVDTVQGICAGIFQFSGIDKRTGKKITVTEGRFDYNLINPE